MTGAEAADPDRLAGSRDLGPPSTGDLPADTVPTDTLPADTVPGEDAGADWMPARGADLRWCHDRLIRGARGAEDPGNRDTVRAMPIVLHIPKDTPPARTALLEAAAGAVIRLCLDARVAPDGPWHAGYAGWMDARMRKIARRARGRPWRTVQQLPGVGHAVAGCAARAFEPGPVDRVPPGIGRLQIGGTEVPADDPGDPPPATPVLWLDPDLEMSVGKTAAQVGHAVMLLAAEMDAERLHRWCAEGLPCAVRVADRRRWADLCARATAGDRGTAAVVDAGYTEVAPGSMTVIAEDRPGGVGGRADAD